MSSSQATSVTMSHRSSTLRALRHRQTRATKDSVQVRKATRSLPVSSWLPRISTGKASWPTVVSSTSTTVSASAPNAASAMPLRAAPVACAVSITPSSEVPRSFIHT